MLIERLRILLLFDDVEIDVGSVATAELGDDHRRADQPLLAHIGEDEDVLTLFGISDLPGETALRQIDDFADGFAVVGQVDGVEMARDVEELLFVGWLDTADLVIDHDLFKCSYRRTARA